MSNLALVDLSTGEILVEGVAECKTFEQAQRDNKFGQKKKSQHEDTLAGRYFTLMMLDEVKKEEYTLGELSELGALIVLSTYVKQDSEGKRLPLYLKVSNPLNNKDAFILNPLVINRGMTNSGIAEIFKKI